MPMTFEDRFAVHELVARYNKAIDTGDATGWADTFTEDGVFDGIAGLFSGRAELEGFVRDEIVERRPQRVGGGSLGHHKLPRADRGALKSGWVFEGVVEVALDLVSAAFSKVLPAIDAVCTAFVECLSLLDPGRSLRVISEGVEDNRDWCRC